MKYATAADYVYVFLGFFGAAATGFGWPSLTILFGSVVDVFVDFEVAHDNATAAGQPTDQIVADFMSQIYMLSGLMLVVMAVFIIGRRIGKRRNLNEINNSKYLKAIT